MEIEPRPGIEPENDVFDQPYRWNHPIYHNIDETISEEGCLDLWWFMLGAIVISMFLYLVIFNDRSGVNSSDWYERLDKYCLSPDPALVFALLSFTSVLLAFVAHFMFSRSNQRIVRYGAILMLIFSYIGMLVWCLALFVGHSPRNSMFVLVLLIAVVVGWLLLAGHGKEDCYVDWGLYISLVLLFYLGYYNLGLIDLNPWYHTKGHKRNEGFL